MTIMVQLTNTDNSEYAKKAQNRRVLIQYPSGYSHELFPGESISLAVHGKEKWSISELCDDS